MHCKGCWSGTYGHKANLTFEDMDKIVTEGKELGARLFMMTGGEPTVRMNDILKLMEKHQDCQFAAYSNSTLINQEMCDKIKKLGNLIFLLSIEGTPESNDSRRGDGQYQAVMNAMDLPPQERYSLRHVHLLHESSISKRSRIPSSSRCWLIRAPTSASTSTICPSARTWSWTCFPPLSSGREHHQKDPLGAVG